MKVQYTKKHTDDFGHTFEVGWVAEHTDSEGAARIKLGVCKQVDQDTRSFQFTPEKTAKEMENCAPDSVAVKQNK